MTQSFAPPSPYPRPGEIVGESWVVERVLGEGGMGLVARARHAVLHTPVALKFMNPHFLTVAGAVERFINEGKASGRIKSDHVVPVVDARKLPNGAPYLVMECLEGVDLDALLARDGRPGLPAGRAVHFVLQALRGLQAAHAVGIVHRDMKPSNCFVVAKDGEDDFVKILDFGISKLGREAGGSLTRTNSTLGTPLYMSPEQAKSPRDVDARSDLYSTGAILYELLAGRAPFFSEGVELLEILIKLVTEEPPPLASLRPDLPPALAAAVHRALAREPAARYATALDMAEALAPFAPPHSAHVLARMRAFRPPADAAPPAPGGGASGAFAAASAAPPASPLAETLGEPPDGPSSTALMPPPAPPPHAPSGTQLLAPPARAPAIEPPPRSQARPSSRRGPAPRSPLAYALPAAALVLAAAAAAGLAARARPAADAGPSASRPAATAPSPPADPPAAPSVEAERAEARSAAPPAPPVTDLTALPAPSAAAPPSLAPPPIAPPRPRPHPVDRAYVGVKQ